MNVVDPAVARQYREAGWWGDETLADLVADHARHTPEGIAYIDAVGRLTWSELHDRALGLAGGLARAGVEPGHRVAVWMPDSALQHLAFLAVEQAGAVLVGIGARAGRREVEHLLDKARCRFLVTSGDLTAAAGPIVCDRASTRHVTLHGDGAGEVDGVRLDSAAPPDEERSRRRRGPDDIYLINSTSGTTGLPKAVVHTQNRWRYFHQKAVANGDLTSADVFLAAVPAPFGFGIWTSHVTPLRLGATTVVFDRFVPETALAAIEREQVTVVGCVSTQFIMMLGSPELETRDLSSLRVVFTGGEAVPYERARAFEEATGATILQFYGSNETGLLSGTTLDDCHERRLRTAGRIVPEMQVRLFEGDLDVTATGRGRPGCKGPATAVGYLDDKAADEQLFSRDGWMLMADICEIDDDGYLTVVGRSSDIIIRGGKNISAPQVEADVASHPAVAHVAAVAMPDLIFGERVCAYVELRPGRTLDLPALTAHLASRGISKELFPERLIVVDELPRSSGAKVAKGELREDIEQRLAAEAETGGPATAEPSVPIKAGDAPRSRPDKPSPPVGADR